MRKKDGAMNGTPQIVPISELRQSHRSVLQQLKHGPVYLAQRSRPAAVLVSTEQWDRISARMDELETMIDILQSKLEVAAGEATYVDIELETLETVTNALPT